MLNTNLCILTKTKWRPHVHENQTRATTISHI